MALMQPREEDVSVKYEIKPVRYANSKMALNLGSLSIAEKYWIVERSEKMSPLVSKKGLQSRVRFDFAAEFGRPVSKSSVQRILQQKKAIKQQFAVWKRFKEKSYGK